MNSRLLLLSLASATAWTGCSTQAVNALSSDVGPDAGEPVDVGTFDSGQGAPDVRPPDLGLADSGFPDGGGGADAAPSDVGPLVCVFPEAIQEGPAQLDELPNPDELDSHVIRSFPDQERFIVTWLFGPGPRSDERYPVVRGYAPTGVHLFEQDLFSLMPSGPIHDTAQSEPGFYLALAAGGPILGDRLWNELGAEHFVSPAPQFKFGVPAFAGRSVRVPEYPATVGGSGHPELLRLRTYERSTGAVTTATVSYFGLEQGFEEARAITSDPAELWISLVQDFDFPPTPIALLLDPVRADIMEPIYGRSCTVLLSHDVIAYQGNAALVSDCGGSEGGVHLMLGRGSFRSELEVLAGINPRLPSKIAFNGRDLAVATWAEGEMAPVIRFYSAGGSPQGAGGIRLPVPAGLEGALPRSLSIGAISGALGGFDEGKAAWGVTYSYSEPLGPLRTFFARLGPCGTNLPQ